MRAGAVSLVALGVLFVVSCTAPPPATTGTAADEAAIREMGAKYAAAWNKGDVTTLVSMVTEDYEAVGADGKVVKGRAAVEEMEKASATQRAGLPMALTVNTSMLKWAGANAAATGGTWTMAGVPAGMGADHGAWSAFAVKSADGQWRLASGLVAEYVPPPAMPPPPPAPAKGSGSDK